MSNYLSSKLGQIFKNVGFSSIKQFIKGFFDILISLLKETVKRLVKLVKDLVLAVVDSIKIVIDKTKSKAEKADAVFKLVSITITNCVLEVLFELVEKQIPIPGFIMEVLQIILTVMATNIVMIKLNELDIFDLKYGIMVSKIEEIYAQYNEEYTNQLRAEEAVHEKNQVDILNSIKQEIKEIELRINDIDIYSEFGAHHLNQINSIFDIDIDFEDEWIQFIGLA